MKARAAKLAPLALTALLIAPQAIGLYALTSPALPDDERTIVHVLNRITFGPRPGDVEKVKAMGLERYIDQQLSPQRIADEGMDARLSGLPSVTMSSREISEKYEQPQQEQRRAQQQMQAQAARGGTAPTEEE